MASSEDANPVVLMKRIEATEGWKVMSRIHIHATSYRVFKGNYEEIHRALEAYHNPEIGLPLWEVKNRAKLDLFRREMVRLVHNYVASAKSLFEHTRKFVKEYYSNSAFEKEYLRKVDETFHDPFSSLVIQLRDYTLHNDLPTISANLLFEPNKPFRFRILLDVASLRKWSRWSAKSKEYLKTLGPELELDVVVDDYNTKVSSFYEWFGRQLQPLHTKELAETETLLERLRELTAGDVIS